MVPHLGSLDQWLATFPAARRASPVRDNGWVQPPVIVLNGPTASGKSSLAVELALAVQASGRGAEVVNTDSMLVYRGMDIGTAKPTIAERRGVVHHLVDIAEVTETASVADFQRLAREAIAECRARGVVPVVVGGSALYVHAVIDEFSFPATDPQVRARWEQRLDEVGPEALHGELAARSPQAAAQILPGNGRRIVRALEVLELTGEFTPKLPEWTAAIEGVHQFGLELPRELMDRRIDERVEQMWADGLVEEVRSLAERGLREGVTAWRAIGYRQVLQYLDGQINEAQARAAVKAATRRFARKQLSWFRRDPRVTWLPAVDPGLVAKILDSCGLD
ncbi:MAG TPA: tRNA (adenosine(37)-N6)-dimethylallyltransferase MiaA [Candidatus Luteococcus avicola]|nr:tRNA (adenosine(37)-N6)-dimethylallyltransferase MiaA [Candidatus Luteococcus avicola]